MTDEALEQRHAASVADIDLGHFAPYLLHNLDHHFQDLLSRVLHEFDLTVVEWRILVVLSRSEVLTMDKIVRVIHVPQSTVSRNVQKLYERRLIQRAWNEQDGRVAEIRISHSGQDRQRAATETLVSACEDEVARLVDDDASQWIEMMRKILKRLGPEKYLDLD